MAPRNGILQELETIAPLLAGIGPVMPYEVPERYFDDLPGLVLMRIKTKDAIGADEELKLLSPLLGGLKKEMPYKIPDGYFEKITIPEKREVPVRNISFARRAWRYAAAAVVAGLIGAGAWFMIDGTTVKNTAALAQSDSVSATELAGISDSEIEDFLDGGITTLNFEPVGSSGEIKDEDVRLMLAEISDRELENYLN